MNKIFGHNIEPGAFAEIPRNGMYLRRGNERVDIAGYATTEWVVTGESLEDSILEKVREMLKEQEPVFIKMTCHNCGAGVYQKAEDHIFKCKFCRTTYLVGTEMIRDGLDK